MFTSRTRSFALIVLATGGLCSSAHASTFDAIYAFGDSLSDVGNIFAATGGIEPGAPYVNGEFSNGPVWVQDLATNLGLGPLSPSLLGGTDYAYGAAETGATPVHTANVTDLTGVGGQIDQFQTAHPTADPNALYTIWIGSDDLIDILTSGGTPVQDATDIAAAVSNVDTAIGDLAADGAKNILLVTVPDFGKTPEAIADGPVAAGAASALAAGFDSGLVASADTIASLEGLHLSVLDTYSLLDAIVGSPSSYGFSDVTTPCLTGAVNYAGGTVCSTNTAMQNQHLFWDNIHPTEAGHAIIAEAALDVVTPEPAYISLIAAGLLGLGLVFRRHRV